MDRRPSSFPRSRNFLPSGSSQPSGSFATALSLYTYIYIYTHRHFELLLALLPLSPPFLLQRGRIVSTISSFARFMRCSRWKGFVR